MLPIWLRYFVWYSNDGHYQYFPLLAVVVGVLAYRRWPEAIERRRESSATIGMAGQISTALVFVASYLLDSVWLAMFGWIFGTAALMYDLLGVRGFRVLMPVWMLQWLILALPLNLDDSLIFRMQMLASRLASLLLDGLGVLHVREGAILITRESSYLTEEACSGVRSLFSSLAVIATYGVATRQHGGRIALNLLLVLPWVLVGNAIRVALTVILADRVSPWWASGTGHDLLSLAVFGFILLMVWSTQQLLRLWTENVVRWFWMEYDAETAYGKPEDAPEPNGARIAPEDVGDTTSRRTLRIAVVFFVCTLGIIAGRTLWVRYTSADPIERVGSERLPDPGLEALPTLLAGWTQTGYEHVRRSRESIFASDSYTWTYAREGNRAIVSVDCPWNEWHDLSICYTAIGWDVEMQTGQVLGTGLPAAIEGSPAAIEGSPAAIQGSVPLRHARLTMRRSDDLHGRVLFTVVDAGRHDVQPVHWRSLGGRGIGLWPSLITTARRSLGIRLARPLQMPLSTIQLYCDRKGSFDEAGEEAVRQLFTQARAHLLESRRWTGSDPRLPRDGS